MHVTLQQLKLFHAVVKHGGFTRAANEMHLTQPAVSIQIKRLEDHVGLPLFEHVGRKMHMTLAGRELYAACSDILERLDAFVGTIDSLKGEVSGPLRISVVTTAKYFLPHLLGAFVQDYPKVNPFLTVTNRANVLQRLEDNLDDVVIMGQVPVGMKVEAIPFLENVLVVVAPPDHPFADGRLVTLAELAAERMLVREEGSGTRIAMGKLFEEHGLSPTFHMELGSSEAIKQGVMAKLGIAVLSLHSLHLELTMGRIAMLNVEGFPQRRPWYAVYNKGKRHSLAVTRFIDFLMEKGAESALNPIRENLER